ncbi:GbsR/MarR family transcriptional regulator [Saccharomonospora saliphila]|uniref:GbsR/MarR family transcriptional regulator n=1 Tax=Saccharomonospora saliphila TaxID=369829 RepID=UPI0009FBEF73|nr:MarR family transcriptional regulator [Saccharomonospora saliphila]
MASRPQSQRDPGDRDGPGGVEQDEAAGRDDAPARDEEAVRAYIERLGLTLTDIGLQRTAARVFAALTTADSGTMTSAELAEALSISPAAVSGAVRSLEQLGMIAKERRPGERRDHYRLWDDFWYTTFLKRNRMLAIWREVSMEGARTLGPDTPAGGRQAEMADFLAFMIDEMPKLLERWHRRRSGGA